MKFAYHRRVAPVSRIVRIGMAPFVQRADGVLVGLFPIDHLAWTDTIARRHASNLKSLGSIGGVIGNKIRTAALSEI